MMNLLWKLLLFATIASLSVVDAKAQFSRELFAPGELLVRLKPASEAAFYARSGAVKREGLYQSAWTLVSLPKGTSVESASSSFLRDPAVEAVQPNFYYYLAVDPDDTHFGTLWGMPQISAPLAWDTETGSSDTIVAVIDTGIRYTHEDLAANIWTNPLEIPGNNTDDDSNGLIDDVYGYDFFFNDNNPDDDFGHGTHVAGTIGAAGNNAIGVVGVNWNVKMIAVKIYDSTGFGTTSAMLINAYNYITALKLRGENIRVTNNSYAGCDEACGYDQATKDALDAMGDAGILNVFAAGNDARDVETAPAYPASYNSASVLSAAASTSTDTRSGFSNFGAISVDLAAPGSGIISTIFNGTGYGSKSGTSMASPHVAGAAALLSSHNPALNNASLKATLMNTVDALANWDGAVRSGGRLNVANALANQTVCDITLNPESQFVFPEGGDFAIDVTVPDGCDYNVKKNADLFFGTITSPETGSGDSTISYSVSGNSGQLRGGKIFIGDREFQITQSTSQAFPHRGFIDFEGDGRTDFTAIQNIGGQMIWHTLGSGGYQGFSFGLFADDVPIPGHYDGDLINDLAVWRRSTGTFYVYLSATSAVQVVNFGVDGDNPIVTQDFDGDGINDFAVVRKQNGKLIWY
ncbi:MAG: S8 family serine peptidase, partial [Acidobacteriota bacterium]|nr:S8 family serine peptidase [Acidobacteriota bacterium]